MSMPKTPKVETPAAAPEQPSLDLAERRLGGSEDNTAEKMKNRKRGRSALRINLQPGGGGVTSTGVNVASG